MEQSGSGSIGEMPEGLIVQKSRAAKAEVSS
jgi:hypothetical protein